SSGTTAAHCTAAAATTCRSGASCAARPRWMPNINPPPRRPRRQWYSNAPMNASTPAPRSEAPDEVSALARGLTLLRTLAEHNEPLSHTELARLTGIPKATVSRLVGTLVSHNHLRQQRGSDRYELAPGVLDLGNAYLRNFDLRTSIRPLLAELAEFAGATVHLAVRDRYDMVLIDTVRPDSGLIFSRLDIGARLNICTSAIGRAYLHLLEPAERAELIKSARIAASDEWARIGRGVETALAEADSTG